MRDEVPMKAPASPLREGLEPLSALQGDRWPNIGAQELTVGVDNADTEARALAASTCQRGL